MSEAKLSGKGKKGRTKTSQKGLKRRRGPLLQPPKPVGRPEDYTEELGLEICRRMVEGESLTAICRAPEPLPDGTPAPRMFPCRGVVLSWIYDLKHPEFALRYALAMKIRAEGYAEEVTDIADNAPATKEDVFKARLQVDTRKFIVSKLLPKFRDVLAVETIEPAGEDAPETFEAAAAVVESLVGGGGPVGRRKR